MVAFSTVIFLPEAREYMCTYIIHVWQQHGLSGWKRVFRSLKWTDGNSAMGNCVMLWCRWVGGTGKRLSRTLGKQGNWSVMLMNRTAQTLAQHLPTITPTHTPSSFLAPHHLSYRSPSIHYKNRPLSTYLPFNARHSSGYKRNP